MCDDSGVIYADGDGDVVVDLGDVVLGMDDLDEQTKRDLLANGFFDKSPDKSPDPGCRWCRGTGKVKLLVSETECDCAR